jgi:endonuclease/exonuclease/phosphatase family metal-dependent hydrolase
MLASRLTLWLVAILALGGLAWHASLPAPLGPAHGSSVEGEVARNKTRQFTSTSPHPAPLRATAEGGSGEGDTLRVGTFNIHGGKGADGRRDLDRVAECLRGLDFVALNEVHGPQLGQTLDQAAELGQKLGLAWLFAPNVRTWYRFDSGNGLLSALPVEFWQRIPLVRGRERGYRNVVLVGLKHRDRTIHVLLTHLTGGEDRGRQEQLRTVITLFLSLAPPAILMGDLNTDAADPQVRQLLATTGVIDPVGVILGTATPPRIDWIIARGLRPVDAGVREEGASDHPMFWAELRLE